MIRKDIRAFIDKHKDKPILEIGPFMNPFMTKDSYNVYYSDVQDKEGIFSMYRNNTHLGKPEDIYEKIVHIDYVIEKTYQEAIDDRLFSVVFSCHVIEHVNNIIHHFQDLNKILDEDGYVVMIVPDKRFCFDHFREITPFRDALDVYYSDIMEKDEKKGSSGARLAFDYYYNINRSHNDPVLYTNVQQTFLPIARENRFSVAYDIYKRVKNGKAIESPHYWAFTCVSFLSLLRDILIANMLPYTLHSYYPTLPKTQEFAIILQKDTNILSNKKRRDEEIAKIINLSESEHADENQSVRLENYALKTENDVLREENNRLSTENYDILNSSSWKLTKPVREIMDFLRKKES